MTRIVAVMSGRFFVYWGQKMIAVTTTLEAAQAVTRLYRC